MDKHTREIMHSSESMDEVTPQDFYEQLHKEFSFQFDLAANKKSTKCPNFYSVRDNALIQPWNGRNWCNPPYGRGVINWVKKAAEESQRSGALICMLLVPRTDTEWFSIAAKSADEIRFVKGRLKFEGQKNPAPFPSCIVIWYGKHSPISRLREEAPYQWNLIWRRS